MQFFSCFDSEEHLERCRYNHNSICLTVTFAWTRAMAMLRMEHESEGLKEDDGGTSGMCNRKSRWKIRSGILHFTAEYIFASLLYGVKAMATPACAVPFTLQNELGHMTQECIKNGQFGVEIWRKKDWQAYGCRAPPALRTWPDLEIWYSYPVTVRPLSAGIQFCVVSINCVIS